MNHWLSRRSLRQSLVGLSCSSLGLGSDLHSRTLVTATPTAPLASSPAVAGGTVRSTIHIVRLLYVLSSCLRSYPPGTGLAVVRAAYRLDVFGTTWSCGRALDQRRDPRVVLSLDPEGYPILLNAPCTGKPNVSSGCGYRLISEIPPILVQMLKTRRRTLRNAIAGTLCFPAETFKPLYRGYGSGGRCRIRTYDFHRVKVTLYR